MFFSFKITPLVRSIFLNDGFNVQNLISPNNIAPGI